MLTKKLLSLLELRNLRQRADVHVSHPSDTLAQTGKLSLVSAQLLPNRGIDVGQLLYFLRAMDYPAEIIGFVDAHRAELDHLRSALLERVRDLEVHTTVLSFADALQAFTFVNSMTVIAARLDDLGIEPASTEAADRPDTRPAG